MGELEKSWFSHIKVNQKHNFVKPETIVHIETIEQVWKERVNFCEMVK